MKRLFQVLGVLALIGIGWADIVFAFCMGR